VPNARTEQKNSRAVTPVPGDNSMPIRQTSLRSFHVVEQLPIDYSSEIFAHYPRLKLGVTQSVNYYGAQLSRMADHIITESLPDCTDWAITGPAYNVLPGGPNLLCAYMHEHLGNTLPDSIALSVVKLRVEPDDLEITDSESLNNYHNYSMFSQQDRTKLYEQSREPLIEPHDFRGRSILFVNDIHVTGTQQRYMQRAFDKVHPQQICWLYILAVDRGIAEAHPEVEYQINHSCIASFEEFAELLATHDLEYTSRCITRLLSYDVSQIATMFHQLDQDRKRTILELAMAEGRFGGDYFKEKIDLLKSCVG